MRAQGWPVCGMCTKRSVNTIFFQLFSAGLRHVKITPRSAEPFTRPLVKWHYSTMPSSNRPCLQTPTYSSLCLRLSIQAMMISRLLTSLGCRLRPGACLKVDIIL